MGLQNIVINSCIGIPISYALYVLTHISSGQTPSVTFYIYLAFSILAYFGTVNMIPRIKEMLLKAQIYGMDINKQGTPGGTIQIPESLGIVPATIFLIINTVGIMYSKVYQEKLVFMHCAAVLSISMAILLGFVDDVIDIAWRYKIWIPMFASLPVLVAYSGVTYVVVPIPLRSFLGDIVDLNYLYYIYMTMLSIFCTNSINIYAGINGIEVGQSLVIGCCILLYNVIEISLAHVAGKFETIQLHMLSIIIIVPYLCVTKALFKFNAYPSQVFVGDTFCYFSGMVFAVVGILGHFSKTLLLFFIPQIINFVYSIPQLLQIIPCPRHRLPKFNQETKLLEPIKTNLTLINLFLIIKGPTSEQNACQHLIIFQVICGALGFAIRYYGANLLF